MTHKNPALRAGNVVKASDVPAGKGLCWRLIMAAHLYVWVAAPAVAAAKPVVAKPAKFALEGNKWCIENQDNNSSLVLDQTELRQTVYIFGCNNSTIQVKGKVNAVVLGKKGVVVKSRDMEARGVGQVA